MLCDGAPGGEGLLCRNLDPASPTGLAQPFLWITFMSQHTQRMEFCSQGSHSEPHAPTTLSPDPRQGCGVIERLGYHLCSVLDPLGSLQGDQWLLIWWCFHSGKFTGLYLVVPTGLDLRVSVCPFFPSFVLFLGGDLPVYPFCKIQENPFNCYCFKLFFYF